ncbi:hypothetical protein LZ32DRAFT_280172 [Colletotrichum eremochloae]|nr:hypothetical protein LZ32DRAFT_280172 [Colletotrichum eremochloae]
MVTALAKCHTRDDAHRHHPSSITHHSPSIVSLLRCSIFVLASSLLPCTIDHQPPEHTSPRCLPPPCAAACRPAIGCLSLVSPNMRCVASSKSLRRLTPLKPPCFGNLDRRPHFLFLSLSLTHSLTHLFLTLASPSIPSNRQAKLNACSLARHTPVPLARPSSQDRHANTQTHTQRRVLTYCIRLQIHWPRQLPPKSLESRR